MDLYEPLLFPALRQLDAERVHDLTLSLLALAQSSPAGRFLLRRLAGPLPQQEVSLFGLSFPNILGVAAGFDKNVQAPCGLALLGFGHVEVGTITPWPQAGNPRPRVFRLPADRALINRMGFPNRGMVHAAQQLRALPRRRQFVVGVSLGKQKETALAAAAGDYVAVMRAVYPFADYLAINVSSPNTPGLRELQGGRYLSNILQRLGEENRRLAQKHQVGARPLLLKIAPDLAWDELDEILAVANERHVAGIIATNTTTSRSMVSDVRRVEAGGLSGVPLHERALEVVGHIRRRTDGRLPVIGVGGVMGADDACAMLNAGASLVQVYTGLVYAGPQMPGRLLRGVARRRRPHA